MAGTYLFYYCCHYSYYILEGIYALEIVTAHIYLYIFTEGIVGGAGHHQAELVEKYSAAKLSQFLKASCYNYYISRYLPKYSVSYLITCPLIPRPPPSPDCHSRTDLLGPQSRSLQVIDPASLRRHL